MLSIRFFGLLMAGLVLGSVSAFADTVVCPDLTTLQWLAGYVSFLGVIKVLGACIIAAGFLFLTFGIIAQVIFYTRVLLEAIGYAASAALIAGGSWVSQEYLTWTVFIGCLLFAGTVNATLYIHQIKGDDPKRLAALFMVVWGAVAVYYNMPEVGFLASLALMTILGFSVGVEKLSYAFGFENEKAVPTGTTAALLLLALFLVVRFGAPHAPAPIAVFETGIFWVGSFVAMTGLLILSSNFHTNGSNYVPLQIMTVVVYIALLAIGMIFGINPLAGMAGTFLVLYLAEKPLEMPKDSAVSVGVLLLISGAILYGAWWWGHAHIDLVQQYLTTHLEV